MLPVFTYIRDNADIRNIIPYYIPFKQSFRMPYLWRLRIMDIDSLTQSLSPNNNGMVYPDCPLDNEESMETNFEACRLWDHGAVEPWGAVLKHERHWGVSKPQKSHHEISMTRITQLHALGTHVPKGHSHVPQPLFPQRKSHCQIILPLPL